MAERKHNFFDYRNVGTNQGAKHQYRFETVRASSEVLFADAPNGVFKFLLFHTHSIAAWTRALCQEVVPYSGKRFSIYSNGTIMIHCKKEDQKRKGTKGPQPLQEFINAFARIKKNAEKYKKEEEVLKGLEGLSMEDKSPGAPKGGKPKEEEPEPRAPTVPAEEPEPTDCCFCLHCLD